MFIKRKIEPFLIQRSKEYPAIAIMGPRQSGKTTLAKHIFPNHKYLNLEDFELREYATKDPKGFLKLYANDHGLILDEIQRVPNLTSYIQLSVDENRIPGYFVLTGSQNILIGNKISQSLAGRIAIITLLPFCIQELKEAGIISSAAEELIFKGNYPPIYANNIEPSSWYKNYINTYVEKDIKQIQNVEKLSEFRRFMALCAGRIGQVLNISSLATDASITVNTANSWLSLLEESYIIYLLKPHYQNFSKRVIKAPKIYFYDTGLACSLLGIDNLTNLNTHYLRGGLFESLIISEFYKNFYNLDKNPKVNFWRDNHGHELDAIIEKGNELVAIEIKAGKTINSDFFKGLKFWHELTKIDQKQSFIIYGGDSKQLRSEGMVLPWIDTYEII